MLAISEYFMLIQCLENIGEGFLHVCISSYYEFKTNGPIDLVFSLEMSLLID